jgi:hypothetical protein
VIPRLSLMISIARRSDGSLRLIVRALGENGRRLSAQRTSVVLTAWSESDDVVRFRFNHLPSGAVGYLQSNESLLELCGALGLSVSG